MSPACYEHQGNGQPVKADDNLSIAQAAVFYSYASHYEN